MIAFLAGAALAMELGAGIRDSLDDPGLVDGPRLVARVPAGAFAVELGGFYRTNPQPYADLDETLLQIIDPIDEDADYVHARPLDRWTAHLLANWAFGVPERTEGWSGGPRLLAGIELRRLERWNLTWSDAGVERSLDGSEFDFPIVAGFAFEVGRGPMRVRSVFAERLVSEAACCGEDGEPWADSKWRAHFTAAVDLLWRLP